MPENFSNLFQLESIFKKQLAIYLLFSKSEQLSIPIDLIEEGEEFKFIIQCENILRNREEVAGKNRVSIHFDYYFIIDKKQIDFISLYYMLYNKYMNFVIMYYPNYIETSIIPEILDKIKNSEKLKGAMQGLMIYDENENNSKFSQFENSLREEIKKLGTEIEFSVKYGEDQSDLLPKNETLLKILEKEFKTTGEYDLDLEKHYGEDKIQLFEMYYKQYLTDNLLYYLNKDTKNFNLLSLINPEKPPFLIQNNKFIFNILFKDSNKTWIGQFFPYIFIENKKSYNSYKDIIKNLILTFGSSKRVHTPFSIKNEDAFSFKNFTESEKLILYKTPVGKAKSRAEFSYDRYVDNYLKGTLTPEEKKFNKDILDILKTFPYFRFNGDTFAIISLEIMTAKSIHKITIRGMIFNTSTEKESECLIHYKNAYELEQISTIKERLRKLAFMYNKLFNFYPYHPFFFNRKNIYSTLYTANALGLSIEKSYNKNLIELYQIHTILDKLWDTYEVDKKENIIQYKDEVEKELLERITKVYKDQLYLWMIIYIEKYYYYRGMEQEAKNYNNKRKWNFTKNFDDFILKVESRLNQETSGEIKHKIMAKARNTPSKFSFIPITDGLYYLCLFSSKQNQLKIIKLNCISFFPYELIYFQKFLQKIGISVKKIIEFKVPKNFCKGILINNISQQDFEKITTKFMGTSYNEHFYDDLLMAHDFSKMEEFQEKLEKGEIP